MSRVNGQKPGVKRDAKGRVVKGGANLNPSGRPPVTEAQREAREALDAATPAAVAKLVELMEHGEPELQFKAAKAIVDKGVPDALDGEALKPSNPWAGLTPAQLLEIARQPK